MADKNDPRITYQDEYLKGQKVKMTEYKNKYGNDHMHCEFCWGKFSENPKDLHVGFLSENGEWICPECFNDFKEMFEWEVIGEKGK